MQNIVDSWLNDGWTADGLIHITLINRTKAWQVTPLQFFYENALTDMCKHYCVSMQAKDAIFKIIVLITR